MGPWAFEQPFEALLFDMDGTLIDSIAVAERVWGAWAKRHGLDAARFVPTIHGRRGIETIAALGLPGIDPATEADAITAAELRDVAGLVPIAGAMAFLKALPQNRWAIVTSAPLGLARLRLAAAGIAAPPVLVTAEDVAFGKPRPDCYRVAAGRLGADPVRCLVFEDAEAGIAAGEAAGATLLVITATHRHRLDTPHRALPDYQGLAAAAGPDGRIEVGFSGSDESRRPPQERGV